MEAAEVADVAADPANAGDRVDREDRVDTGGVGRAEHGPEVARLLDALADQQEGLLAERHRVALDLPRPHDGEEAVDRGGLEVDGR